MLFDKSGFGTSGRGEDPDQNMTVRERGVVSDDNN